LLAKHSKLLEPQRTRRSRISRSKALLQNTLYTLRSMIHENDLHKYFIPLLLGSRPRPLIMPEHPQAAVSSTTVFKPDIFKGKVAFVTGGGSGQALHPWSPFSCVMADPATPAHQGFAMRRLRL
jgi:hypothetical protein